MNQTQLVKEGIRWIPGNGHSIKFWQDDWLGVGPLLKYTRTGIPQEVEELTVADYMDAEGH